MAALESPDGGAFGIRRHRVSRLPLVELRRSGDPVPVTPNIFAWVMLIGWPLVVIGFYAWRRASGRLAETTAWMIILPVMFLPAVIGYKLPGIPEMDKHRVGFLAVAVALQLFHRRELPQRRIFDFPRAVLLVLVVGGLFTVATNTDVTTQGVRVLPGLTARDALAMTLSNVLDFYLPFTVGLCVFRTERDLRDLFKVLSLCGLIYLPFCLAEVRLSPQLHRWVYGFYPSQFVQAFRAGGFRPVVFMGHGLAVATFSFSCFCAALALRRASAVCHPVSPGWRSILTGGLVVACKSLGAILYSSVAVVFHLLRSNKILARLVLVIAILVVAYPVMRAHQVVPTRDVVSFFQQFSGDRAQSLAFRFTNEDVLLARAMKRPLFGWGTWGRNRVFEPISGRDISVTDGQWIMLLGAYGYVGFIGSFAPLVYPLFLFFRRRRRLPPVLQALVGVLALMLALFTLDLLPNAMSDNLPTAYAGVLFAMMTRLHAPPRPSRQRVRRNWFVVEQSEPQEAGRPPP